MEKKTFYNTVHPFWVEHYRKKEEQRQQKKEKKNDTRTRQERQT
jgi:hypothetical protein